MPVKGYSNDGRSETNSVSFSFLEKVQTGLGKVPEIKKS